MKTPRHLRSLAARIRRLNLPARAKAALAWLTLRSRPLVLAILRFLRRHRRFCASLLLGAIVAWLLTWVPLAGKFLALCALVVGAVIGLVHELRESLDRLFAQTHLLDD